MAELFLTDLQKNSGMLKYKNKKDTWEEGNMEKWFVSMKKADFVQIAEKYHISPIIARLIRNREIIGNQNIDYYLNGTIADLHDGMSMRNMDTAVEILAERSGSKKRSV